MALWERDASMHSIAKQIAWIGIVVIILVCGQQTFAASRSAAQGAEVAVDLTMDLTSESNWKFDGIENGDDLGWSVNGAGDLNGDGYDDIVVGAPLYGDDQKGAAFVFYGASSGLSLMPDWENSGCDQGDRFGSAVSSAGDVNGDGFDDLMVGSDGYKVDFGTSGIPKSGAAFVYLGSSEGITTTHVWTVTAEARDISFGYSVSSAGDINNDGYADVLVGAPYFETGVEQVNEGKVYLYLGSAAGLSTAPDWTFECNNPTAKCGQSVAPGGDVNNDGFADVIVGAPNYDDADGDEGAAFIFLGSDAGISDTPDWMIVGESEGDNLGMSVAGAGDVNGDGFDDVLVGSPNASDETYLDVGAAYLYLGSPTGPSLVPDWVTFGVETFSMYGSSVQGIGDVNNDGYDDVVIGSHLYGMNGTELDDRPDEGAVYLYKGSPTGLSSEPDWFTVGGKADVQFGFSVGHAGDVNGDYGADVIIGAPKYRFDDKTVLGRALVFYAQNVEDFKVYIPVTIE